MLTRLLGAILMVPVLLNASLLFPRQMRPLGSYLEFAVPEMIMILLAAAVGFGVGKVVLRERLFAWILGLMVLTLILAFLANSLSRWMDLSGWILLSLGLFGLAFWVATREKFPWSALWALLFGLTALATLSFYIGLGALSIPLILLALALSVTFLKPQLPKLPKSPEAFSIILGPSIVAIMAYRGLLPFIYILAIAPAALELYLLQSGKRGNLVSSGLSLLFFVILEILGTYA